MQPSLSILICTIPKRVLLLRRLMDRLIPQQEKLGKDRVEILAVGDAKDGTPMTIGAKRNKLLDSAKMSHLAFIDDDDLVHSNYASLILSALETDPDVVGIKGIQTVDGEKDTAAFFVHSMQYRDWFEENGVRYRCPNHLSPVRSSLAKAVRFPETGPVANYGEDRDYSLRLYPLLKTEVMIEQPIYLYDSRTRK